jgi:hypothetical protein
MALTKITSDGIGDNAITADKIATGAITVVDIPDGEITAAKLHTTAITDKLGYTPADESTLGTLASLNSISASNIDNSTITANKLASGVAVSNIGYTPVNKAGDTMTGALTIGGVLLGNVQIDIMALWRSADVQGYKSSYSDGGGVNYTWDNGIVRIDTSVGSHNWDVGKIRLPAGRYQIALQYRPSPTQHGWNVYGSNSNAHIIRLQTDAGLGSYSTRAEIRAQLNKDVGYSMMFLSSTYVVPSDETFRIGMQTDPYGTGGFKCWIEAAYLLRVE